MRKSLIVFTILIVLTLSACFPETIEYEFKLGEGQDTVEVNTTWENSGAWLEGDGSIVIEASSQGTVDTSTLGLYEITYTLSYDEVTYSETRYVIVVDQIAPVITLNQGVDSLSVNEIWTDAGVTVTDNSGEALTIIVTGTVDTTTIGTYEIVYSAEDSSGNTFSMTRFVTIFE